MENLRAFKWVYGEQGAGPGWAVSGWAGLGLGKGGNAVLEASGWPAGRRRALRPAVGLRPAWRANLGPAGGLYWIRK